MVTLSEFGHSDTDTMEVLANTAIDEKGIDITPNTIRVRVRRPRNVEPDSERIITISEEQGIQALVDRTLGEESTRIRTYIFDREKWDEERARKWIKDHGMSVKNISDIEGLPGLHLSGNHSQLIAAGEKSLVLKPKFVPDTCYDLRGTWVLTSKDAGCGYAYGLVSLSDPHEIDSKSFDEAASQHLVSQKDRLRWWGDDSLWAYPVESFQPFQEPIEVEIPAGVHTIIDSIQLKGLSTKEFSGGMVGFFFSAPVAESLSTSVVLPPGSEYTPVQDVHLTLCYLGDTDAFPLGTIYSIVQHLALRSAPVLINIDGTGRFSNQEENDKNAFYLSINSPQLIEMRESLTELLEEFDLLPKENYTYTPHITVGYVPQDTPVLVGDLSSLQNRSVTLPTITLAWGEDRYNFDLMQPQPAAEIDEPEENMDDQLERIIQEIINKKDSQVDDAQPMMAFKAYDGSDWLLTFTTNAFIDREGEIFSTKSIEDYVARHEQDDIKGEFQFWHLPGSKFGDIRWQAVVGRFLVEAGPFDNTEMGQTFKEFFKAYPNGHPDVAPDGWGCSHKYLYRYGDRTDNTYDWFEKKETTVLPRYAAANHHNPEVVWGIMTEDEMNENQKTTLRAVGGDELVSRVLELGESQTKRLEDDGIECKSLEEEQEKQAEQVETPEAPADADTADAEPEPEPEPEPEEAEDTEEKAGKAKKPPMKKEDMAEYPPKPEEEEEEEMEEEEEEEETKAVSASLTVDDIGRALTTIVSQLRSEIKESQKETLAAVETLSEAVKALSRTDEEKIAEKAAGVPATSLEAIIEKALIGRAVGADATRIDGRSSLAKGPPEAESAKDVSSRGLFFDKWSAQDRGQIPRQ